MLTEKMQEIVRKQSALALKVAGGTATADETAELKKLATALSAATGDHAPVVKTDLCVMTRDEFNAFIAKEIADMEAAPEADRLAVLKRNIDRAKPLIAKGDAHVPVEVIPAPTTVDAIAKFEQRLLTLEAQIAVLSAPKAAEPVVAKTDEPAATPEPAVVPDPVVAKDEPVVTPEPAAVPEPVVAKDEPAATPEPEPAPAAPVAKDVDWHDMSKGLAPKDADAAYALLKKNR